MFNPVYSMLRNNPPWMFNKEKKNSYIFTNDKWITNRVSISNKLLLESVRVVKQNKPNEIPSSSFDINEKASIKIEILTRLTKGESRVVLFSDG